MKTRKRGGGFLNYLKRFTRSKKVVPATPSIDTPTPPLDTNISLDMYKYINSNPRLINIINEEMLKSYPNIETYINRLIKLAASTYLLEMSAKHIIKISLNDSVYLGKLLNKHLNELINICIKFNEDTRGKLYGCSSEKYKDMIPTKIKLLEPLPSNATIYDINDLKRRRVSMCHTYENIDKSCPKLQELPRINKYIDTIINYIKDLIECKITFNNDNPDMNNKKKKCVNLSTTLKRFRELNKLRLERNNRLKQNKTNRNKRNCGLIYDNTGNLINIETGNKYNSKCITTYKKEFEKFFKESCKPGKQDYVCQEIEALRIEEAEKEAERSRKERNNAARLEAERSRKERNNAARIKARLEADTAARKEAEVIIHLKEEAERKQPTAPSNNKTTKPINLHRNLENTYKSINNLTINYDEFLSKLTVDQKEDLKSIPYSERKEAIEKYVEMINNNRTGILYYGREYKTYTIYKHAWDFQQDIHAMEQTYN